MLEDSDSRECRICGGSYTQGKVSHTFRRGGHLIVIDDVPAEVRDVCGDVLFTPRTSRKLDKLVAGYEQHVPKDTAPVYEFG